ncbi:MAG: class I adenylate-forming enzyme family protein [Thermodesulfobacteriota bacterium]|nr:class I adenylate-forming enzyme family protein [Thermodesulfobacteriota bacterium]
MNPEKVLRETAQKFPEKVCITFHEEHITFSQLDIMVDTLVHGLKRLGVERGDRVVSLLPNCCEFVILYFATLRAGAIVVPLDIRMKGEELSEILKDAQPRVLVTNSDLISYPIESLHNLKMITVSKKTRDSFLSWDEVMGCKDPETIEEHTYHEDDEALYLYTSGTTGRPKGVVLSFRNLDEFPLCMSELLQSTKEEVIGIVLPMSHIAGPLTCNEIVDKGSTMIIFDSMKPDVLIHGIEKHNITCFYGVPIIFQLILSSPHLENYTLKNLRVIVMMGTTIPVSLMKQVKERYPHVAVIQGYGLTETSPWISLTPLGDADRKMASIGKPVPRAMVKLIGSDGKEVSPGKVGEIAVKGPMVMLGYHNQPEATAEMIREGWLYTGDLARFDDEGFLYHLGRKDDLIITGGLNVYPAEIENVILNHPRVAEVAVIGTPDVARGTIIKAFVVPNSDRSVTVEELISFCRERLTTYKVPKIIELKDSLPKTGSGKVAKNQL